MGTAKGILVYTFVTNSSTETATAVDWGGVSLTAVPGGSAADTVTEAGRCTAWFAGATLAGRANNTVTVTRTNNANEMYAVAVTVTADTAATEVTGTTLVQENAAWAEISVDDGSPGTNSVRYSGTFHGKPGPLGSGASSTALQTIAIASTRGASVIRETTAGQGSRGVGWSDTGDDHAEVALAIREIADASNITMSVGAVNIGF